MLNIPQKVYTVDYKNKYVGVNNRFLHHNAMVFSFSVRDHAEYLKSKFVVWDHYPQIKKLKNKQYVLRCKRENKQRPLIDINEFVLSEQETEEFMLRLAVNSIDMCIIHSIEEDNTSFRILSYDILAAKETNRHYFIDNLNNIYDKKETTS
jgi:hypothetical protein